MNNQRYAIPVAASIAVLLFGGFVWWRHEEVKDALPPAHIAVVVDASDSMRAGCADDLAAIRGAMVTVEGFNLRRLIEEIDQGHLKSIREHDSKEVALIRCEKPADPTEIKAAIVRIEVEPPFEEFAKSITEGER